MTFHKKIKVVCVITIPFFNALGLKNHFKYEDGIVLYSYNGQICALLSEAQR